MKIAYIRTSTTSQKDSLEAQEKALTDYYTHKGLKPTEYKIYKEYRSGKHPANSSILQEAIEQCLLHNTNLTVHALDRIGRNASFLLGVYDRMKERDLHVHSLTEGMLEQWPHFGFLALQAQAELLKTEERQKVQKQLAASKGTVNKGGRKAGYKVSDDTKQKIAKSVTATTTYKPPKELVDVTKTVIINSPACKTEKEICADLMAAYETLGYKRNGKSIGAVLTARLYKEVTLTLQR